MFLTRARTEEYRRRAQECFDVARKISLERDRAVILDIAQSWLRLAEQEEKQEKIALPPTAGQPQAAVQQQQQIQLKGEDKNKKE